MDLTKHFEFFNPDTCKEKLHIIGCGAIGSTIAENLVRLGLTNIVLYDFDFVEDKNIANQLYRKIDLGKPKVEALKEILVDINPEIKNTIELVSEGYTGQLLDGYVFMAVDSIDIRREIVDKNKLNLRIKAVFDYRMGLTDAEHYAAKWNNVKQKNDLRNTMNFTQEEADAATPMSACNQMLSVAPTIRTIVAFGVANFMNLVQKKSLKKCIFIDAFGFEVDAFE